MKLTIIKEDTKVKMKGLSKRISRLFVLWAGPRQSRIDSVWQNPSNSPLPTGRQAFTKGEFKFPPLKKGGEGGFSVQDFLQNEFGNASLTLTLP